MASFKMVQIGWVLTLASMSYFSGCAHSIHQYAVGGSDIVDIKSKDFIKGREIESYAERFVILSINSDTSYVDKAYQNLLEHCARGQVMGIHGKISTSFGFLSYTDKIQLKGLCMNEPILKN